MKVAPLLFTAFVVFSYSASAQSIDSTGATRNTQIHNVVESFTRPGGFNTFVVNTFTSPVGTVGSPYLFQKWGKLSLDSVDNQPVKKSITYQANIDLQKNQVIVKSGDGTAFTPTTDNIQGFHIQSGDTSLVFVKENIEGVSKFVEQLSTSGKYTLLVDKQIVYERADYVDKGFVQTGKNYNEFVHKNTLYLKTNGTLQKVPLKRKQFLALLQGDPKAQAVAKKVINATDDPFDEYLVAGVVEEINKIQ
ncbi:hypothetical protein [Chitinophaga sp. Cy-1792]|uniref:hypothetical protein n=1 Tax=Chitinophaga sp. Cy-1792 TaxID=2608339 RepID=UPI00141E2A92|nr:hypothetical protein [Chitinophaga sp. Cy-1792]NIG57538.1 hypothetical protein [Chitinophaga sp. Cy-1792]